MLRILVVDDHPIVRQGIIRIIEDMPHMKVTGEAGTGQEALKKMRENDYDLVLLDISMPDRDGIDIMVELRKIRADLPVLVLTMHPERNYAIRMFKAGAFGYLTKDKAPYELIEAIESVTSGKKFVSHDFADILDFSSLSVTDETAYKSLSNREFEIMCMIARGKTVKDIADTLSLSAKTISTHRSHILEKLKLKNNAEIMHFAIENSLIT